MIQKLSHATIYVLDQDSAYDFYVNKLGMELRMDVTMEGGFRWLTVGPVGQPDMNLVLMPIGGPAMSEEQAAAVRDLVRAGAFGGGVLQTPDCRSAYAELKEKGVEFLREPTEQFYGIEALLKDDSGNWFSLTQRKG